MFNKESKGWDPMESMVYPRNSARSMQTEDGNFYMAGINWFDITFPHLKHISKLN